MKLTRMSESLITERYAGKCLAYIVEERQDEEVEDIELEDEDVEEEDALKQALRKAARGAIDVPDEEDEEPDVPVVGVSVDDDEDDMPEVSPEPERETAPANDVDAIDEIEFDRGRLAQESLKYNMRKLAREIDERRKFLADNSGKFGTGRKAELPWSGKSVRLTDQLEEDLEEEIRARLRKLDNLQKSTENMGSLTGQETVSRDPSYKDKFRYWWSRATSVPGAISGLREALEYAMHDRFQSFGKFRDPQADAAMPDSELVRLVAEGAKPVAHTRRDPAFIQIPKDIEDDVAFIKYPGGGAIWYKPYRTFFRGRKGFAQRPYDPYGSEADDPNQNLAKAYLWNNRVMKDVDPQIYYFINGILLGYPRDFVVDFVETESATEVPDILPEKTLLQKMFNRVKERIRSWVSGDGTPGSIVGDSWVTRLLKRMTPDGIKDLYDSALTDMQDRPYGAFAGKNITRSSDSGDLNSELAKILSP